MNRKNERFMKESLKLSKNEDNVDKSWFAIAINKKMVSLVRPTKKGAKSKSFFTLLLLLGGDIESNPGPTQQKTCKNCHSCLEESTATAKPDSNSCLSCQSIENPENPPSIANPLSPSSALAPPPSAPPKILTDIKSTIKTYDIDPKYPIPAQDSRPFLSRFKNKPHHHITTTYQNLADYIFTIQNEIYLPLGNEEKYLASWTDLEPKKKGKKPYEEILIEIFHTNPASEPWLEIIIHIPSATICFVCSEIDSFVESYIPLIKDNVNGKPKSKEKNEHTENYQDSQTIDKTPHSELSNLLFDTTLPSVEINGAVENKEEHSLLWEEIKNLKKDIREMKKTITKNDKQEAHYIDPVYKELAMQYEKNNELEKENKMLKNEIQKLVNQISQINPNDTNSHWRTETRRRANHQPQFTQQNFEHQNYYEPLFSHQYKHDISKLTNTAYQQVSSQSRNQTQINPAYQKISNQSQNQTLPNPANQHISSQSQNQTRTSPARQQVSNHSQNQSSRNQSASVMELNKTTTKKTVCIIGDSMTKGLKPFKMMPKYAKVRSISIPGARTKDLHHHIIPSIEQAPDAIVIHGGTNDLMGSNAENICENLLQLAAKVSANSPHTKVFISTVILRQDKPLLNQEISKLNNLIKDKCSQNQISVIDNGNIDDTDLNNSRLHLNSIGTSKLAKNIINGVKLSLAPISNP